MFSKKFFRKSTERKEIEKAIKAEGFDPQLFTDEAGYVYKKHQHPETKILVCLEGSMKITVAGQVYSFEPGDKLIVPGNTPHSAIVGPHGCTFYWSEKII